MSGIHDAMMNNGEPEPTPEDNVNLFCPDCESAYHSNVMSIEPIDGTIRVKYTKFIGHANCELYTSNEGDVMERFTCPNGCNDHGVPTKMQRFDSNGRLTPWDVWKAGQMATRIYKLTSELEDLEKEYKNNGYEAAYTI